MERNTLRHKRKNLTQDCEWRNPISLKPPIGNQVKHLLILLSFLFLSSPVIGQKKGTSILYKWKSGSRWVWKSFGVDGVQTKYMGEIKNGKPDGRGIKFKPYGGKYFGEWKNGKEQRLLQMEIHMKVNGRMENKMVKGNGLYLMDLSM